MNTLDEIMEEFIMGWVAYKKRDLFLQWSHLEVPTDVYNMSRAYQLLIQGDYDEA